MDRGSTISRLERVGKCHGLLHDRQQGKPSTLLDSLICQVSLRPRSTPPVENLDFVCLALTFLHFLHQLAR